MSKSFDWFDFLFGGIIVSFFVNLASGFLQPVIQKTIESHSHKARQRKQRYEALIELEAQRLISDPHEEMVYWFWVQRCRVWVIFHRANIFICSLSLLIFLSLVSLEDGRLAFLYMAGFLLSLYLYLTGV